MFILHAAHHWNKHSIVLQTALQWKKTAEETASLDHQQLLVGDYGQRRVSPDLQRGGTVSDIRPLVEVLASEPGVQLCSSGSEV